MRTIHALLASPKIDPWLDPYRQFINVAGVVTQQRGWNCCFCLNVQSSILFHPEHPKNLQDVSLSRVFDHGQQRHQQDASGCRAVRQRHETKLWWSVSGLVGSQSTSLDQILVLQRPAMMAIGMGMDGMRMIKIDWSDILQDILMWRDSLKNLVCCLVFRSVSGTSYRFKTRLLLVAAIFSSALSTVEQGFADVPQMISGCSSSCPKFGISTYFNHSFQMISLWLFQTWHWHLGYFKKEATLAGKSNHGWSMHAVSNSYRGGKSHNALMRLLHSSCRWLNHLRKKKQSNDHCNFWCTTYCLISNCV